MQKQKFEYGILDETNHRFVTPGGLWDEITYKGIYSTSNIVKALNDLSREGWEVVSESSNATSRSWTLRRPIG